MQSCMHAWAGYSTQFVAMHAKYCVYIVRGCWISEADLCTFRDSKCYC